MQINEKLIKTGILKIKRVTGTTDTNGFLRTGISGSNNYVLGGRAVSKNGFYIPFSEGGPWTLKCMYWDMTTTGFVSTQVTVDVIYAEIS